MIYYGILTPLAVILAAMITILALPLVALWSIAVTVIMVAYIFKRIYETIMDQVDKQYDR